LARFRTGTVAGPRPNCWVRLGVIADNILNIGRAKEKQPGTRSQTIMLDRSLRRDTHISVIDYPLKTSSAEKRNHPVRGSFDRAFQHDDRVDLLDGLESDRRNQGFILPRTVEAMSASSKTCASHAHAASMIGPGIRSGL
jgi:hypothetical protein